MALDTIISNTEPKWWKEAIVYQIWPASFKDSNDDGVGDLQGIISKLDYIKDLGVDVIWLSPMYDSPQEDMGYDISNYEAIYPKYGTMQDMDELILQVHKRGMKILVDLVINHCSSEHEWFKESRSSKTNAKRDWFWWRPAKYDAEGNRHPPNNWASFFGGSAWTWDELTQEYYLRLFAKGQPDFNWENEETRKLIYDTAVKFWLQKGCDGFRIDTAGLYSKVENLPDLPIVDLSNEFQNPGALTLNGPRIHEFIRELNKECFTGYDIMTVGEVGSGDLENLIKFTGAHNKEIDEMFLFDVVNLGRCPNFRYEVVEFDLNDFKKLIISTFKFVEDTDCWSTIYLENHDQARSISRFGDDSTDKNWGLSGKLLAILQMTLTGTCYIYQGQEIGMINLRDWRIDQYEDVEVKGYYNAIKQRTNDEQVIKNFEIGLSKLSRDHARTPVQWDGDSENAGFSTCTEPWFAINENYNKINVKQQLHDANSILTFYKEMIQLRKCFKDVMCYGYDFQMYDEEDLQLFAYSKRSKSHLIYVVLNFSNAECRYKRHLPGQYELLVSNYRGEVGTTDVLQPWEGQAYVVHALATETAPVFLPSRLGKQQQQHER